MNDGLWSGLGGSAGEVAGPVAFRRRFKEGVGPGYTGGLYVVDLSRGTMQSLTLYANTTMRFPDVVPGAGFTLVLRQDNTGSRTVTWPSTVAWGGGTAPTLTTTGNKTDIISFVGSPDGQRWFGFLSGLNF